MHSSIAQRLQKLESRQPARIILETTVDGQARRMTAPKFVEAGYDFLQAKIVSGNSISDAKVLLSTFPSVIQ